LRDGKFDWDDDKAESNFRKHGVTFEMARDMFEDPFLLEWSDGDQSQIEDRFGALGMVDQRVLFVAYAIRGEFIRIISARRAVAVERRRYHHENQA
jgi:uncharacterized protein